MSEKGRLQPGVIWAKCLAGKKASAKLYRGDGSPEFVPAWNKGSGTSILLSWFSMEVKVTPGGSINSQMSQVLCMFNQGDSRSLKVVPTIRVIMGFTESKSTRELEEATQKRWQGLETIWSERQWCLLPLPNVYLMGDNSIFTKEKFLNVNIWNWDIICNDLAQLMWKMEIKWV